MRKHWITKTTKYPKHTNKDIYAIIFYLIMLASFLFIVSTWKDVKGNERYQKKTKKIIKILAE